MLYCIVTDTRRRPGTKFDPPQSGRSQQSAGRRRLLARSLELRVCAALLASGLLGAITTITSYECTP